MEKLSLPNVTLVLVSGIGYQTEGNIHAIKESQKLVDFGAVRYIQDGSITDINSWNHFIIYELHRYISTDFAMLIHSDGYVINPAAWRDSFLSYDYIGAPWPLPKDDYSYRTPSNEIIRVGNSVSIRSKKILELPHALGLEWKEFYGNTNEDGFLCVHNRDALIQRGANFAPLEVAKYFSKEHEIEENKAIKTFAFHSL